MEEHITKVLPLSVAQQSIWFAQKFAHPDAIFNVAEYLEIHGPIDPQKLEDALRIAVMDAEAVRARFTENGSEPQQIIPPRFEGTIPFIDVSTQPDPKVAAERWMWAELTAPHDPIHHTLWTSAIFKAADDRFFWYHRAHHILLDGFSAGLFARRVDNVYNALIDELTPSESLFGSLSVLIEEENAYRSSERFVRDRQYWVALFEDKPKPVSLAKRRSAGAAGLFRKSGILPSHLVNELRRVAGHFDVSLAQILIAATAAYLYRVSGVEDLVLGLPVTARSNGRLRSIPSMVANAVPLRFAMHPHLTVKDLARQAARQVRQALRHQCYRYEDLRRDLNMLAANHHLMTTVINIEPFNYDLRFGGHEATVHNLSNSTIEDLAIFIYDQGNGKDVRIDFDTNPLLYKEMDLAEHLQRFLRLLGTVVEDSQQTVGRINILDGQERRRLLRGWHGPVRETSDKCLPVLFKEQVDKTPDSIALVDGENGVTYAALNAKANRVAHALIEEGVAPEQIVAIVLPPSADLVVAILGTLKAGAAYLPIDPQYPADRIAFMLDDGRPACVITDDAVSGNLRRPYRGFFWVGLVVWRDPNVNLDDIDRRTSLSLLSPAYVIYTSGSTGKPKGVVITHGSLSNFLCGMQAELMLSVQDRLCSVTTISFDIAALEIFLPLICGARLIIAPRVTVRDPSALLSLIVETGTTIMQATPSLWQALISEGPEALRGLRVLVGGEALSVRLADDLRKWASKVVNLYGPTETTIWSTSMVLDGQMAEAPPIGRPILNTRVYVLDAALQPAPVGVAGELYIAGAGLARGYLDQPALTAEHFVADPFGHPGSRMYRTGDFVRWRTDGTLDFIGRVDRQLKMHGFRIELGEIETALAACPGVSRGAVVAREDQPGDKRLIAYVVPVAGGEVEIDPILLRQHLSKSLPDYLIPSAFVTVSALPLTPNGKLDQKALPAPDAQLRVGYVAPCTVNEEKLCNLFAEVLGVERVGVEDNFFELGGYSLLVLRLGRRIRDEIRAAFPMANVYAVPVVRDLAALLENTDTVTDKPDLSREVSFPAYLRAPIEKAPAEASRIFLTGATGFVGTYLLASLLTETPARVFPHVRAPNLPAGRDRLKQALSRWHLTHVWDDERIEVLIGNLAAPELGLDERGVSIVRDQCDAIYHCGAEVDFVQAYARLKPANVDSLFPLLEWMEIGCPKRLHFISTLGAIDQTVDVQEIAEDSPLESWQGLVSGYSQSKWVADTLARRAQMIGFPISIHRLGNITGDRAHAMCNESDMVWLLAKIGAKLRAVPDLDLPLNMTPVDEVARAIVSLSRTDDAIGKVYHLVSPETVGLANIVWAMRSVGVAVDLVPPADWIMRVQSWLAVSHDDMLAEVLVLASTHEHHAVRPRILANMTIDRLEEIGATIRPVGHELLRRYFLPLAGKDQAVAAGTGNAG